MNHFETKRHKERMELESVLSEHKKWLIKEIESNTEINHVTGEFSRGCLYAYKMALENLKSLDNTAYDHLPDEGDVK